MNTHAVPLVRAMLALVPLSIIAGALLQQPLAAAPAEAPITLVGSWQFNPTDSSFVGGVPYKSGTATFTATPQCLQAVVDIVEVTGLHLHFEYCDPGNGTYVAVSGNPFYDNESTTWLDRLTARRTERRGESVTGTTQFTVAADGKSYFTTSRRTRPDGQLYTSVIHWKRIK